MWVCARIVDSNGIVLAQCDSRLLGFWVEDCPRINGQFRFTTPWLKPGTYRVDLSLGAPWCGFLGRRLFADDISGDTVPEFGGSRGLGARIGLCRLLVGGIRSEKRVRLQRYSG